MPRITFLPSGVIASCADGETVFSVSRRHLDDTQIPTSCIGSGTCGLCRVKIVAGEEFLNPQQAAELKHLGNMYFLTKIRLSCQTEVGGGDVTVEVVQRPGDKR